MLYLILFVTGIPPSEEAALAQPGRRLPPLPARDERLRPMVSEVVDRPDRVRARPGPVLRARHPRQPARVRLARERAAGDAQRRARSSRSCAPRRSREQVEKANEQHYELPPEFFELVLGPRLKYSSCLWPAGVETLAEAEEAMLALTCERAGVEDGMELLDLGCGWGSLTLWLAERYPSARILAVSNSRVQREFIEARARARTSRS